MISPTLTRLLQILTFILLFTQQSFSKNDRKTYIVYMGEYPNEMESAESLHTSMVRSVLDSKFAPDALLHSYKSFNALVARLTKEEAVRMRGMEGVVSVIPDRNHKLLTSRSWDFIGYPENVTRANIESDIIVGVIDSGISPTSDSFNGGGFGTPPQKWKGTCQNITCNNKIVGARYFRISGVFGKNDIISPVDTKGHGTHCTSIAAGNPVGSTSLFGCGLGTVRGGVPLARIAIYKVSWSGGSQTTDVLAAFDTAIEDGVDILSVSSGPPGVDEPKYFDDVYAIGAFHALKKGILTSHAAGNAGPKAASITNTAPWLLSVAATTIDRQCLVNVQLGNGDIYQGMSISPPDLQNKFYPLIYAGDAPNVTNEYGNLSRYCYGPSLNKTLVKGKILLCDDYLDPRIVGSRSGAAGVIYRTDTPLAGIDIYALPAVRVRENNGTAIYSYINSSSNPTATISKCYEGKDPLAPYIDSYSSRGPNKLNPNILKPDLAAPGTNILAAWSPIPPISGVNGDKRMENYKITSGTSMACAHATAAAAYVKSFHPNWSPGAIKSALMTTASRVNPALNGDTEFAYGAGIINPLKAVDPGLVYDVNQVDYVNFMCGQGYTDAQLQKVTNDTSVCTQANIGTDASDLNLPSFALSTTRQDNTKHTFSRTVTNVGSATSTYKSTIATPPSSLSIKVVPDVLQFSSLGESKTFTLTIEGSINDKTVSSSLVWDDGTFQVRSPIIVYDEETSNMDGNDGFVSWFASSSY